LSVVVTSFQLQSSETVYACAGWNVWDAAGAIQWRRIRNGRLLRWRL